MRKKVYIAGKIGKEFPSEATFIKFEKRKDNFYQKDMKHSTRLTVVLEQRLMPLPS